MAAQIGAVGALSFGGSRTRSRCRRAASCTSAHGLMPEVELELRVGRPLRSLSETDGAGRDYWPGTPADPPIIITPTPGGPEP